MQVAQLFQVIRKITKIIIYLIKNTKLVATEKTEKLNPCNPSPCGANAICKERHGAGSCICLPEYFGDPYTGCRPECVTNSECSRETACVNNKCKDPCPGTCGINAECYVNNHAPSCSCLSGYSGNPLQACHLVISKILPSLFLLIYSTSYLLM